MSVDSVDILVPTLNESGTIGNLLSSLRIAIDAVRKHSRWENIAWHTTLIDGGSSDDTVACAARYDVRVLGPVGPGRGLQYARGVDETTGQWIIMLHADMTVRPAALVRWLSFLERHREVKWGILGHDYDARSPGLCATLFWNRLRFHIFGLAYGDQGIFINRPALAAVGGFPQLPLLEDVELSIRLRAAVPGRVGALLHASLRQHQQQGFWTCGLKNQWILFRYLWGRFRGKPIDALASKLYEIHYSRPPGTE